MFIRVGAILSAAGLVLAAGCATTPKAETGTGVNLVKNGAFEEWTDTGPANWELARGRDTTWAPITLATSKAAHAGKACLELPDPGSQDFVVLAQDLDPAVVKLEQTLVMQAWVKAPEYKQLHVVLSFKRGAARVKERLFSSGGPDWEKLFWKLEVPPDADPATFRIEILRHPLGAGQVLVDDVSLRYEE